MNYSLPVMESARMMKMATGDGSPLRQGAGTGPGLIFGTNMIQRTWSARQGIYEETTRQGARPSTPGRALHPRGPLVAPLTYFFLLYIPIYPKNFGEQNRSGVPPPQASVATKNQSRPCSGTLPEGGSLTGGHLHHPGALHDEEGEVHPRG